jgi:hypothetical protein
MVKRILLFLFILGLQSLYSQEYTITGKIFVSTTKEPLPFVPVIIKGTKTGNSSDFDGKFVIKANVLGDSLISTYIGYKRCARKINKSLTVQEINMPMVEDGGVSLDEVVVVMGENPAHRIIRNANKYREENNPDNLRSYQYETYNKIEFDLTRIPKEMREKKIFKPIKFVFDNVDSTNSGEKPSLPFFITESLSDIYYKSDPVRKKEVIKGSKITGMQNSSVSQVLGDMYQRINIYNNNVIAFNKQIPSPVGENALFYYKYYMVDSGFVDGHYTWQIKFKPKRVQELSFTGNIWICDTTWGIKRLEMSMPKDANLNFINAANVIQEYTYQDSTWMMKKDRLVIDFAPTKNSIGFYGRKTTSYRNIVLNKPKPEKFYEFSDAIAVEDSAINRSDDYWAQNRHDSLTNRELKIFKMIDTIQSLPVYKTWVDIFYVAVAGYKKFNNFEIGPYTNLVSYNRLEGVRLRFGGRTSDLFSKWYELAGYVAYGLKDEKWKYSLGFKSFITKKPSRQLIGMRYKSDNEILGQSSNGYTQDNVLASLFRSSPLTSLTRVNSAEAWYEREWFPGLTSRFTLVGRQFIPIGRQTYTGYARDGSLTNVESIYNTEARVNVRFAWKEKYVGDGFTRLSIGTTWPVLQFNYSKSLHNAFKGEYDYHKITLRVTDRIRITPIIGYTDYSFDIGKIFGTVPYPLMELHGGNETLIYDETAYNMMRYYEFASDQFVSMGIYHHFDGLFFNKFPLLRKAKLREVVTIKGVYGSVEDKNRRELIFPSTPLVPVTLRALDKMPYVEASAGIENILKVFRVDALWRLTYRDPKAINNFGVKFTFQFTL